MANFAQATCTFDDVTGLRVLEQSVLKFLEACVIEITCTVSRKCWKLHENGLHR